MRECGLMWCKGGQRGGIGGGMSRQGMWVVVSYSERRDENKTKQNKKKDGELYI